MAGHHSLSLSLPRSQDTPEDGVGECGCQCSTPTHPLPDVFFSLGSYAAIRAGEATSTKLCSSPRPRGTGPQERVFQPGHCGVWGGVTLCGGGGPSCVLQGSAVSLALTLLMIGHKNVSTTVKCLLMLCSKAVLPSHYLKAL